MLILAGVTGAIALVVDTIAAANDRRRHPRPELERTALRLYRAAFVIALVSTVPARLML